MIEKLLENEKKSVIQLLNDKRELRTQVDTLEMELDKLKDKVRELNFDLEQEKKEKERNRGMNSII